MVKPSKDEGDEGAAAEQFQPVNINVTPIIVDGSEAVCRIEPGGPADEPYVDNGLVRLPPGQPVELNFHLQDGDHPELAFDAGRPWSCRAGGCPGLGENDHAQFPHASVANDKLLKVRATPAARNARHYSLNFDGGIRFDPIIIRY
jgi:hypothetical protein